MIALKVILSAKSHDYFLLPLAEYQRGSTYNALTANAALAPLTVSHTKILTPVSRKEEKRPIQRAWSG
jgi:hypothetical protein